MSHTILLQLTGILVLGILAQWIAWRVRLPSILLLLVTGILAGPVFGWLDPDKIFGKMMLPFVSLSVSIILYEGGLNLRLRELRAISWSFFRLATIGVAFSLLLGSVAAHYLLGFRWPVAILFGSILVVTGPTVIGPILRHLRLRGKVGALLKWEGIIVDPLEAILAVLVFTVVQAGTVHESYLEIGFDFVMTLVTGVVVGSMTAGLLVLATSRYWIPDSLHNPVSLMLMFVALTLANALRDESGLVAVTVMGIAVANQKWVSIRHFIEFKETLTVLLISCLFIILSADLELNDLRMLNWQSFVFVAIMILIVRPVSVLAATSGSSLSWQERFFLCCMAPRGIVAAAISSVFALSLVNAGYPRAVEIVPITFLMVFATVLLYGLSAAPLARWLGLIDPNPQGVLFVGADAWVRSIAHALQEEGCPVFLIDTDWENICYCRMASLPCIYGSALADQTREEIDLRGLGRLLAVTSNNEVNSLACLRYAEDFGRQEVYQLPFHITKEGRHEVVPLEHRGRFLFNKKMAYSKIVEIMSIDFKIRKTKLSKVFDYPAYLAKYGSDVVPLFVVKTDGTVRVLTIEDKLDPKPDELIISVFRPESNRLNNTPEYSHVER